jgi:acyl-CoA dehydrogenase
VTARPRGAAEGTRGIGCFLAPRAGTGFRIRRLKDKLGTRSLATGEIEFDGAEAYPLGPLEDGFKTAVSVLNTSRWLNAVGSAGLMRRAFDVASEFAGKREAFGRRIAEFPLVRENLAVMKAETDAALASTAELTELVARIDDGSATEEDVLWHRILVNANKVVTSLAATKVVRRGIETLGGNGTIEDFSPLPRLWRDAIVFESWEGTHNVLCAQVLRDLARYGAVELAAERAGASPELAERIRRSVAEPESGALHFRRQLDELMRSFQARMLAESEPASAELIERRHLVRGWDPERDADYSALIERVLAGPSQAL